MHVSTAGGLSACVGRVQALGAEAVQVFASSPRRWATRDYTPTEVIAFGRALGDLGLPLFIHSSYLVNLASPDPALWSRSADGLAHALSFGALAGAAAVVTHVGSHRGEGFEAGASRVADAVARAADRGCRTLEGVAAGARLPLPSLLLETSAGGGHSLGRSPGELGRLLGDLAGAGVRVGVCLDTAHLFGAGYPIQRAEGLAEFLQELEGALGSAAIGLVHLNDSSAALGSRADRHENLWEGRIGREGLRGWVCHLVLRRVPFVLEVPGFDGRGPDRRNLWRARRLCRPEPTGATA